MQYFFNFSKKFEKNCKRTLFSSVKKLANYDIITMSNLLRYYNASLVEIVVKRSSIRTKAEIL